MNYNTILFIIIILGCMYNVLLIFTGNKEIDKKNCKEKNEDKAKKWESVTTIIVALIFFGLFIFLIVKFSGIGYFYSFLYNMGVFLLYILVLINIINKKDEDKITDDELSYLASIPAMFSIFYNTKFCQDFINIINNYFNTSITYFIVRNITKYFIVVFFLTIIIFLILVKIRKTFKFKKTIKFDNSKIELEKYRYENAKNKTGINFLKGYLKDICSLLKFLFTSFSSHIIYTIISPFIFMYRKAIRLLKQLTKNFSIYVIIVKTFHISIIISLLITYYKLLCSYNENIITDLYAVIITTIIIPIVLNTISGLKKDYNVEK